MTDVRRLPVPVTETWEWQLRAACRELDTAMFFHPEAERGTAKRARDTAAKRVCAGCPVIEECRRHALAVQEPYGVWGGLTAGEREEILHPGRSERRRTPILAREPVTPRESAGTLPGSWPPPGR